MMLVNTSLLIAIFFTQQLVSVLSSQDQSRSEGAAGHDRNNKVGEGSGEKDVEKDKSGVVKKVYGINDDTPTTEGNFEVTDDIEYFFKDRLNAKLRDFDDLKTQIAVLDRHLRKHSVGVVEANDVLKDLDEQVIKPYEDELKAVKNKVMDADDWTSTTIVMINAILDKSEQFLEMSRDKVYKTLDDHVASDEHKNEHKHGEDDHGHDSTVDYADLLTEEDSVDISSQDEELLIEYMDSDIVDLENIIKEKEHLEHHIVEHFNLEDVDEEILKLKVAENVLESIDVKKLKSYEESLKLLRTQIIQSNGRVNTDLAQQVANTMQNAETLSRAFQKNIEIAVAFDHEFEKHEETANIVEVEAPELPTETPVKFTFDISYPEEKVVNKVDDVDHNLFLETKQGVERDSEAIEAEGLLDNVDRNSEAIKAERLKDNVDTDPWIFVKTLLSSPFSTVLVLLTFVLLVAMMATTANRILYKSRTYKGSTCENDKSALISKNTTSPQLETVKEDSGWTSNNWGQSWAATPNRRRKQN